MKIHPFVISTLFLIGLVIAITDFFLASGGHVLIAATIGVVVALFAQIPWTKEIHDRRDLDTYDVSYSIVWVYGLLSVATWILSLEIGSLVTWTLSAYTNSIAAYVVTTMAATVIFALAASLQKDLTQTN